MRFADKGYYIEEYVKCANCGVLVYDHGVTAADDPGARTYCSDWCREWAGLRDAGIERPVLPLPRRGG